MIPAKPTIYADRHFRSRLEASWAAWFDAMGFRWTYEPPPVIAGYQPDFLVDLPPSGDPTWIETKPESYFDGHRDQHLVDLHRWEAHAIATGVPLLVLVGRPGIWTEGRLEQPLVCMAAATFHSAEDGSFRRTDVWFTGCDRCREYGLAPIGQHLDCLCLRDRERRMPKPMESACETVRNMNWDGRHHA